jgi:hypothetical protein
MNLSATSLGRIQHPELRREAEAALSRGEPVRLFEGKSEGAAVQTVVLGDAGRAGQSVGSGATWGEWVGGRLHTPDANHAFDTDGRCLCQACDLAAGYFGDDDE